MNFAGPIDLNALNDSQVSLDGGGFSFGTKPGFIQHHPSDAHVVVPDSHLLFSGNYVRIGSDLIISSGDQKFVVGNYFKGETRPTLTSNDGATLSGQIVDALTGHVHYAQAAAPAAAQAIGHIMKMSGSASAIRNGVSIELHVGDAVQKGDVIQTGSDSSIGMTFVDGSAFGMTSNARMVLNEMIFDPNGSSNSSLISLVQGTITFVAGQTAKNGNMRVETPVATMGIRGTAVLVEIAANDGPTKFSVLAEPDGHTGSFNLYDKSTGQLIGTVSQAGQVTFVSVGGVGQPPSAVEQLKTLADQEAAKGIINQVFQLYFPNFNPDNSNPKTQKFGSSSVNNLAEVVFSTTTFNQQTFLTQIELRFTGTDPVTGAPTQESRLFYNTKAQFSADSITAEQSFVSSVESFKISDVVHITDPDVGTGPFFDVAVPFVPGSAVIKSAVSTNTHLDANFLTQFLHVDQNTGVVSFDRLGFNFLGQGESVTFMLQVTARSGPDSALVIIPITITGDNDVPNGPPTIVVGPETVVTGTVKEDTPADAACLKADGTITFRDVDLTDTHTVSQVFTSSVSPVPSTPGGKPPLPGFTPGTELGKLEIVLDPENTTDTINTGTVQWHFSLRDDDPVLQSLAEGQTITQVYTITIKDIHDAYVTQTVTITITGTNDAPVLSADTTNSPAPNTPVIHSTAEVPNSTGAPNSVVDVATGTLAFIDVDLSDTHQASAELHPGSASVVWSGGSYSDIPQATRDALNNAMTAAVSENNTDTDDHGSVSWTFKLPDYLFDFLARGETLTLVYDVTITDNNGLSSTQQVTVQVGAANDRPVITVIDTPGSVKEDVNLDAGFLKDTGSVTFTDADLSDNHTAHVAYKSSTGFISSALATALGSALTVPTAALAAGDHDFNWDFKLDTSLVQYLAKGETVTVTYNITVSDGSGAANSTSAPQTVTIVITGTNDAPTVAAALTATANEGASAFTRNLLSGASDVDHGETATLHLTNVKYSVDGGSLSSSAPAGISLGGDGHTLTINPANSSFDHLALGQHTTIEVAYDVTDAQGATVHQTETITINGTNDAPTVAAVLTATASEGASSFTRNLLSGASDVDDGETATLHLTNVKYKVDGGNASSNAPAGISLGADGHTLTIDPANSAFDYLNVGQHTTIQVAYDVTDAHGATVHQTETITINGTNDAPALDVSDVYMTQSYSNFGWTHNFTVHDLMGSDADAGNDTYTLKVTAQDGDLYIADNHNGYNNSTGLFVSGEGSETLNVSGSLNQINAALTGIQDGLTYRTGSFENDVEKMTVVLTDTTPGHGGSDTVNFIFKQGGSGGATMTGTSGTDVFFGSSGQDRFVFSSSGFGHDTIVNFDVQNDLIKIGAGQSQSLSALMAHASSANGGQDTLITPDTSHPADTILLKGVHFYGLSA